MRQTLPYISQPVSRPLRLEPIPEGFACIASAPPSGTPPRLPVCAPIQLMTSLPLLHLVPSKHFFNRGFFDNQNLQFLGKNLVSCVVFRVFLDLTFRLVDQSCVLSQLCTLEQSYSIRTSLFLYEGGTCRPETSKPKLQKVSYLSAQHI